MDPDTIMQELESPSSFSDTMSTLPTLEGHNYTFCDNSTSEPNIYYFYNKIQFSIMWLLFISIVVLNSSVIATLLFRNTRKSRMNFFIMQLAVTDLFVGLVYVLMDIIQKTTIAWFAGDFLCKSLKFLQAVVMYASTYVLVALSIDRCDAITNPMNFSGSWFRAKALIISAWSISIIFSIPLLILYEVKQVQGQSQCWIDLGTPLKWRVWMTLVSVIIFVLPALTITICYTVIVLTIWTNSKTVSMEPRGTSFKKNKGLRNAPDVESQLHRASSRGLIPRAKIKSVKMTFVIVFVFIVCWSPYIIFDLLQVYNYIPPTQTNLAIATLIQSLAPLNSAANPIICCMFSPHIFKSLKRMPPYNWFWCRKTKQSRASRSGTDSTANSDLMSSSNVRKNHSIAASLNRSSSAMVTKSFESNVRRKQVILMSSRK